MSLSSAAAAPELIGLLGGSFNPPHKGHAALALAALEQLGLDRVLLMPVCAPPHPKAEPLRAGEHRLQMCAMLAAEADPDGRLQASSLEIDRGGRSYTADTLEELHARHPEASLTLILGDDVAMTLADWSRPHAILKLARIAVAPRSHAGSEVLAALRRIDPEAAVDLLDMRPLAVSSTRARQAIAEGREAAELLGGAVEGYVRQQRLYRGLVWPEVSADED